MESLCYLVEKIGPYHAARLDTAARAAEGKIVALEFAPQDQTYTWEPLTPDADARFLTRTLPDTDPPGRKALWRSLDECRPTTVFLNGWADRRALWALGWCLRRRVPAVVMSDSQERDEPRRAWKEAVKRRFVRCCQAAFVAGQRHEEYAHALGMPAGQIVNGYDVVDNHYFQAGAQAAREDPGTWWPRLGLPAHRRYFLCVSRFVPKKNLPRLLRAFADYRAQHRAAGGATDDLWDLVLLGDGAGRAELETQIARDDLTAQVHLVGFRQYGELPGYYGLAAALVLASTSDQWGLAVNEAMAAGLPVLVSEACGCCPELVHDGVNGFRFDPTDEKRLAARLLQMATMDVEPWRAMGEASRALVAEWSLDRFAAGMWRAARLAREAPAVSPLHPARILDRLLFRVLARVRTP